MRHKAQTTDSTRSDLPKGEARYSSSIPKWQLSVMVFGATLCVAMLSFISVPLGFLGMSVFSIVIMSYSEHRRRGLWEMAASFKMLSLKGEQDEAKAVQAKTAKGVAQNTDDIKILKSQMQAMMARSVASEAALVPDDLPPPPVQARSRLREIVSPYLREKKVVSADEAAMPSTQDVPHKVREEKSKQEPDPNYNAKDYDFISDVVVKELVRNAISHERVDVFVQPVMRLPQRQTRYYEMFARIRAKPGLYLPAARYMKIAEQDNMNGRIDEMLLMHSLKTIENSAHISRAAPFFLNITGETLRNGAFMKRLLTFLQKNRHLAPRLVFEMAQRDFLALNEASKQVIKGLGTLGCAFSIDHVETQHFDIGALRR
jgi:cyclic-di-GMP phosphodiesterase TipF (flagellum assembly factor)